MDMDVRVRRVGRVCKKTIRTAASTGLRTSVGSLVVVVPPFVSRRLYSRRSIRQLHSQRGSSWLYSECRVRQRCEAKRAGSMAD